MSNTRERDRKHEPRQLHVALHRDDLLVEARADAEPPGSLCRRGRCGEGGGGASVRYYFVRARRAERRAPRAFQTVARVVMRPCVGTHAEPVCAQDRMLLVWVRRLRAR